MGCFDHHRRDFTILGLFSIMRLVIDNITEQRSRHRAAATNSLVFFCRSSSSFPSSSSSFSRPPRFSAAWTRS